MKILVPVMKSLSAHILFSFPFVGGAIFMCVLIIDCHGFKRSSHVVQYGNAIKSIFFTQHRQKEHLAHMNVVYLSTHMRRGQILNRDWTCRWRFFKWCTQTLCCVSIRKSQKVVSKVCEKGEYVLINFWHF